MLYDTVIVSFKILLLRNALGSLEVWSLVILL